MLRQLVLASFIVITPMATAMAADMPGDGRIGRLFDERRAPRVEQALQPQEREIAVFFPRKVPGYYGTPTSFQQRNYYGTGHNAVYDYLPYVCEALNTCWNSDRH
jgi:hypothetical protein